MKPQARYSSCLTPMQLHDFMFTPDRSSSTLETGELSPWTTSEISARRNYLLTNRHFLVDSGLEVLNLKNIFFLYLQLFHISWCWGYLMTSSCHSESKAAGHIGHKAEKCWGFKAHLETIQCSLPAQSRVSSSRLLRAMSSQIFIMPKEKDFTNFLDNLFQYWSPSQPTAPCPLTGHH